MIALVWDCAVAAAVWYVIGIVAGGIASRIGR